MPAEGETRKSAHTGTAEHASHLDELDWDFSSIHIERPV